MKRQGFYILFFIPMFTACLESPEMTTGIVNGKEKPTVVTDSTNLLHKDGALIFQGELISKGKGEIIKRGFFWSTVSNNPGRNDNDIAISDVSLNVFKYELKGASGGEKTYYWRAYAENSFGIEYGNVRSFKTPRIWEEKKQFSANPRGNGAIFYMNNKIYVTCGQLPWLQPVNNTWEYNIMNDDWNETELLFPGVERIYPVAIAFENFSIIGTGLGAGGLLLKDFYLFNPLVPAKMWTEIITPDDFKVRRDATAFSLKGKGYIVGGLSQGEILKDVWQYDVNIDNWEKINDFPVEICEGISISGNNRRFVGFGKSDDSKRMLWEYDEPNDTWIEFATLPVGVTKRIYSGVIVENSIYIVDGDNHIWALDLNDITKTWKHKSDLPPEFLNIDGNGGDQTLIASENSNSIFVGLGFTKLLYEYRPLWDN